MDLTTWDIALIIMIQREIDDSDGSLMSVPYSLLQALGNRLDQLELKRESHADRRLIESLSRLLNADCLTKATTTRLRFVGDQEYQVTHLGEVLAQWHTENARFSGEPLTAIFRAFITQLTEIAEKAEVANTEEVFRHNVTLPLQHVAKEMLVNIQRHQKDLDRRHETLREFIPTLLTEEGEAVIEQCEGKLAEVITTIDDLQEAIMVSMSSTSALMGRIEGQAKLGNHEGFDACIEELSRRLHSINQWTLQRAIDWFEYHNIVHGFLRTVIRVDRNRRLSEALKRAIATPPGWTLEIANTPVFTRMREDIARPPTKQIVPRVLRCTQLREREFEDVTPDELPERLLSFVLDALEVSREATATSILKQASELSAESHVQAGQLASQVPWLMEIMMTHGLLDDTVAAWRPVVPGLEMEELRVTARAKKDK